MGYILPYVPIQSMQYAVRMEKPQRGLPVVSAVPPIQNETVSTPFNLKNHNPSGVKKRFHQVLSEIEGKGLIINETI